MKGNVHFIVLPIAVALLAGFIAPWIAGVTGYDLYAFAQENVAPTLLFTLLGAILGWAIAAFSMSGRFVYRGFSEKKDLEEKLDLYDKELTDLQTELARCQITSKFHGFETEVESQTRDVLTREHDWHKR